MDEFAKFGADVAGSGIIALVLTWFMRELTKMFERLSKLVESSTAATAAATSAIQENREALERIAEVIVRCQGPRGGR